MRPPMNGSFLDYLARLFSGGTDNEGSSIDLGPYHPYGINSYGTPGRFPMLRWSYTRPQYLLPDDLRSTLPFYYRLYSEDELRDMLRREGLPLYTR